MTETTGGRTQPDHEGLTDPPARHSLRTHGRGTIIRGVVRLLPLVAGAVLLIGCGNDLDASGGNGTSTSLPVSTHVADSATTAAPTTATQPAPSAPTQATTQPPPIETSVIPPEPDTSEVDRSAEALAFFRSTETLCAQEATRVGNQVIPPSYFSDASVINVADPSFRVRDGAGNELLVNLDDRIVTSPSGPEGELPNLYSFSCPTDLYPGTLHA